MSDYALIPASHVYLVRPGEVLLQQRANTGFRDGEWVAGAAGHLEVGETAQQAAVRELVEELGVRVGPADLRLVTVMHRAVPGGPAVDQRIDWFWTAERWAGTPRILEPAKCSGLDWFSFDALPAPMPPYERRILAAVAGAAPIPVASHHGLAED